MLTNFDIAELTEFRRELHRHSEVSGEEVETASKITAALRPLLPTRILTVEKLVRQSFSVPSSTRCQLRNSITLLGRHKPKEKAMFVVMMAI
jgi:hypothetical protein